MITRDGVVRQTVGISARMGRWPVVLQVLVGGLVGAAFVFASGALLFGRNGASWATTATIVIGSAVLVVVGNWVSWRASNSVWVYLAVVVPIGAAVRTDAWWLLALTVPMLLLPSVTLLMNREDDPIDADPIPRKRRTSAV